MRQDKAKLKSKLWERRARRVRARVRGTVVRPRLSVFRSSKHVQVQLIDDASGRTLITADDRAVLKAGTSGKNSINSQNKKMDIAHRTGELLAEKALAKSITKVIFDRGGYAYHGRLKAVAEGARKGGLKF